MSENKGSYSVEEARGIARFMIDTCEAQGRKFTAEESKLYGSIIDQLKAAAPSDAGRKTVAEAPHTPRSAAAKSSGNLFQDAAGNKFHAHLLSEPLTSDGVVECGEIGETFRNILLGQPLPKGITRIQNSAGSDPSNSSYTVPAIISTRLWDLARAAAVTQQAGCQTLPLISGTTHLIKLASDVQPTWRGTNTWTTVPVQQPAFDRVVLQLKSVAAICAISQELMEDSVNANTALETAMTNALALALDQAVLVGAGTLEPDGITITSGVHETNNLGAGISSYNNVVYAIRDVLNSNHPDISALSWISHPMVQGVYQTLQAGTDGQTLLPPPWVQKLGRVLMTTTMTNGQNQDSPPDTLYQDLIGDFGQGVVLGVRPAGITFDVSNHSTGIDGSNNTYDAFSGFGWLLRIYARLAVGVVRPQWFSKITNQLAVAA